MLTGGGVCDSRLSVEPASLIAAEITLDQAVEIALEKNPDLAITANELLVARGEIERADYLSQFNPQLIGGFDYRTRSGKSNSQDWRTGLSQELEIFGQRGLRQQSAKLGYQRTEAEVRNQVRLLTAAVKMTFYEALRARNRSKLLAELEALNHKLADAARTRFDAGRNWTNRFQSRARAIRREPQHDDQRREIYRLECSSLGRLAGQCGWRGTRTRRRADSRTSATRDGESLGLSQGKASRISKLRRVKSRDSRPKRN